MSLPTNIYEIGLAVESRLADLNVVPDPSQIIWSARAGDMPHIKGKLDLVLRPRRQQDLKSLEKGGQRYGMVMIRVIDVFIRTSFGGTEVNNDRAWYEQHVPVEDAVLNALAGQMLTDSNGLDYLTCPIKYLGTFEERREPAGKPVNLWGEAAHSFEFHFKPKLDLAQLT